MRSTINSGKSNEFMMTAVPWSSIGDQIALATHGQTPRARVVSLELQARQYGGTIVDGMLRIPTRVGTSAVAEPNHDRQRSELVAERARLINECDRLLIAAESTHRDLSVAESRRYDVAYARLRTIEAQLLRAGAPASNARSQVSIARALLATHEAQRRHGRNAFKWAEALGLRIRFEQDGRKLGARGIHQPDRCADGDCITLGTWLHGGVMQKTCAHEIAHHVFGPSEAVADAVASAFKA